MNPREASAYMVLPTSSLAKLRLYGGGPTYTKVNKRVIYRTDWCDAWMEEKARLMVSNETP